jgi:hypothetical protein
MFTRAFWKNVVERAVKTGAQFVLVGVGGNLTDVWSVDWRVVAGAAGAGVFLSVVSSLASVPFGPSQSPSVVYDDDL